MFGKVLQAEQSRLAGILRPKGDADDSVRDFTCLTGCCQRRTKSSRLPAYKTPLIVTTSLDGDLSNNSRTAANIQPQHCLCDGPITRSTLIHQTASQY